MSQIGSPSSPLRVAIIGSGPSAFYAADSLLKRANLAVEVDMYDRLPTPFGLVRGGVAPDHQKIKSVTKAYDRTAADPHFRFYGNVEYGTDIKLEDLKRHYHQVLFATGAQTDRMMDIPGEDLEGSHPATEFVAWYNGHPDFCHLKFDLSQERVAVVGIGNVAMDVARILCRTPEELMQTDIADYALEALRNSKVKEVYVFGRRGPAQAAFTNPEIREMGHLEDCDVWVPPAEAELDSLSREDLVKSPDRSVQTNVEILQEYAQHEWTGKSRRMTFRFLVSPVELGGTDGHVTSMKIVKNKLSRADNGSLRPKATDAYEELPVGLVFRSIGYRGVPLPDIPFHERWGVIPNQLGRVTDTQTNEPVVGLYTAGWIKRGPSGVIGTNKPDAVETVDSMLADMAEEKTFAPSNPGVEEAQALIASRQPRYVTYQDWLKLDQMELARGKEAGRPRVKFTNVEEMLKALGK
ncbi:MAG: FAD-dependent oxidoreductase [Anaerolineales bacterium]|nr:FAD-dependent oxidoreductase [Anaerolineales bacterium]